MKKKNKNKEIVHNEEARKYLSFWQKDHISLFTWACFTHSRSRDVTPESWFLQILCKFSRKIKEKFNIEHNFG